MNFRKVLLALAGLLCICSLTTAQDLVLSQIHSNGLYMEQGQPRPSQQGMAISSLPSDIFGESDADSIASVCSYVEEEADIERANTLILMGIAGAMIAGLSATGLLYSLRRRAKHQQSVQGMQIVGI